MVYTSFYFKTQNHRILMMRKALGCRFPERVLFCPRPLSWWVNGLIVDYRAPNCLPVLYLCTLPKRKKKRNDLSMTVSIQ
jgi:hypothetical protein